MYCLTTEGTPGFLIGNKGAPCEATGLDAIPSDNLFVLYEGFDVDISSVEVYAPVSGNLVAQYWDSGAPGSTKVLTAVAAGTANVNVTLANGPYKYRFSNTEADLNWLSFEPDVDSQGNGLVIHCLAGTYKP
ncbi:hypothetical protein OEZ85_004891 [Tetradesmus obliquus]|uniref:Uncharacterized protein n=1 Tax=Tetradesmus obliquus TaxID=3088 RepID=A0ABY8UJX6_TETOB|nr:hypothetical protein OEZ85_004891 [Tetradesmus obliquus]